MSEPQDKERRAYLKKMETERGYLLEFHRVLAEEDLEFLKRYDALLQAAYLNQETRLDAKTKELVLIAMLVALRSPQHHIESHMQTAKRLGITRKELLEVLELSLPPAGLPAFMQGFEAWRNVYG